MNEKLKNISLTELRPGETFGELKSPISAANLTSDNVLDYLLAKPEKRRQIEIATLGYPITEIPSKSK